jgi:chromate reductase
MNKKIKIFAFGGSLRQGSFTKALLDPDLLREAVKAGCPEGTELDIFDRLGEFPLFNSDLEADLPEPVRDFKARIKAADAILIVTPEYNYSIPGYLKNALDWASRPFPDNSFNDKPAAIISGSNGMLAGSRAQYALRQVGVFLNLHFLNKPEVMIPTITEKIVDGKLVDAHTKEKIAELLKALCDWTNRLNH